NLTEAPPAVVPSPHRIVRHYFVYALLLAFRFLSRIFFRVDFQWVGEVLPGPWRRIRLVCFLNHTSLFEPIFVGAVPGHFLWRIARHGVVPAAEKTLNRPLVGKIFRLVAAHVVSVTRERDHTWYSVLQKIDPDSMVVIFPEGRMKRADGFDAHGRPMSSRGGVAEVIETIAEGRMLIAYSEGLHHIQVPGQRGFRIFKTAKMRLEVVLIEDYIRHIQQRGGNFKREVMEDLDRRRDLYASPDWNSAGSETPSAALAGK
ncbi:MAG: 1-acyl-sn-glycerol-3-phosphate acyltransferase, partial [Acidobacteriota bacterium]